MAVEPLITHGYRVGTIGGATMLHLIRVTYKHESAVWGQKQRLIRMTAHCRPDLRVSKILDLHTPLAVVECKTCREEVSRLQLLAQQAREDSEGGFADSLLNLKTSKTAKNAPIGRFVFRGNTYPVKEELKSRFGAVWAGSRGGPRDEWWVEDVPLGSKAHADMVKFAVAAQLKGFHLLDEEAVRAASVPRFDEIREHVWGHRRRFRNGQEICQANMTTEEYAFYLQELDKKGRHRTSEHRKAESHPNRKLLEQAIEEARAMAAAPFVPYTATELLSGAPSSFLGLPHTDRRTGEAVDIPDYLAYTPDPRKRPHLPERDWLNEQERLRYEAMLKRNIEQYGTGYSYLIQNTMAELYRGPDRDPDQEVARIQAADEFLKAHFPKGGVTRSLARFFVPSRLHQEFHTRFAQWCNEKKLEDYNALRQIFGLPPIGHGRTNPLGCPVRRRLEELAHRCGVSSAELVAMLTDSPRSH